MFVSCDHRPSAFRFEAHWARIIPGRDEGVYGWLAANYLDRRLHAQARDANTLTQTHTRNIFWLEYRPSC